MVNDVQQFLEFGTNLFHLSTRAGIEEYFAQQAIVFTQHPTRYLHVALEGGTRSILMLHDGSKDKGRYKGDAQGISHRLVVLFKGIFKDVQPEFSIKVLEEDASHVIALIYYNSILGREGAEVGKGRTKHGVRGNIATPCLFVILFKSRLHRGDVGKDAILGQEGEYRVKYRKGIFQRYGIDDQLWAEGLNFFKRCEALGVIGKAQAVRVDVVNRSFVVETQEVNEERAHFSGAKDKDFHLLRL